jgi:membrane-associated phospholipid phosphatase
MNNNDTGRPSVDRIGVSIKRRGFLEGAAALGVVGAVGAGPAMAGAKIGIGFTPPPGNQRGTQALTQRMTRADANLSYLMPDPVSNGDEQNLANFAGCYSKGLPHNDLGEVDPAAYLALQRACLTNAAADWAVVPMGGTARQISPQAAIAFQMEGADPARLRIPAAPRFDSEFRASEMAEVYWMALLRDVPFSQYASSSLAAEAVSDLQRFPLFHDVTVDSLFRGVTAGERVGPYLSQFLLKNVPFGPMTITQKYAAGEKDIDFMTSFSECLNIQRGIAPSRALTLDAPHYMQNGRALGEYVHKDFSYQAFLNAALILLGYGGAALDDANPYKGFANRAAFVDFGGPDVLSMVAQVAVLGLKAAWFQKWSVNRTLRPEAFALRVHQDVTGARAYPIHGSLLASPVLDKIHSLHGTYLLPMAFAEGSPTHPAYPAGHASIAGACVTVLKAFFKETFVVPDPVTASDDGGSLNAYSAGGLTVGGELDKLAANIAIGRNIAGVHYWSDGVEGMRLGEQVGIAFLADLRSTYPESFAGFSLTRFDGVKVTI